jgi:hypothetical protein
MEDWWINSALNVADNPCTLYGDIYGHPAYVEGTFVALVLIKADFISMIAETEDAYIKLGEPQSIDRVLKKLAKEEVNK